MFTVLGCIFLVAFLVCFILLIRQVLAQSREYRETLKSIKISLQDIAEYFIYKSI